MLRLADRPVRAIMTPRVELVWLDVEDDPAEIARIRESGQPLRGRQGQPRRRAGRGPYPPTTEACLAGQPLDLRALVGPLLVVHDGLPVLRALEALDQARVSMALVVDEYGEVEGVVTVGRWPRRWSATCPSAASAKEPAIVRRQDGSMLMDGLLAIDEVKLTLGIEPA